eukprot:CAMPEP_0181103170 /NCGR_PEP_ID=MMETSP1071-20121207/14719_1 /TAXON_ID=35127 /ORGANISM="Thalassiosira sp., Strain NH16" /LENGTH=237 /DNA_ID=CAMNT_0023186219 /DNA_START=77 /DNA_END=791 /DNA_ORIENTATION=+
MMFLTAATMFLAASAGAGATSTAAAPIILEGAVQQVDVESHQADLRLRGSIPLPQDAAAALSFADADEDPQDDVYADGLGSIPSLKSAEGTSSWYLSVANQVYACSDNCSNVELKQRDYKEANPSKCQWQMGDPILLRMSDATKCTELNWSVWDEHIGSTEFSWSVWDEHIGSTEFSWSVWDEHIGSMEFSWSVWDGHIGSTELNWSVWDEHIGSTEFSWSVWGEHIGSTELNIFIW